MTDISIRIHMFVSSLKDSILSSHQREDGQDLLEYVLLGGLIAAAIVGALVLWGTNVTTMAQNIGYCIDFTSGTNCNPGF